MIKFEIWKTKKQIIKECSRAIVTVLSIVVVVGLDVFGVVNAFETFPYAVIVDCSYYLWG